MVCACVFVSNGGSRSTTNFGGEMVFYGHFTLRERLFIARDIVSLSMSFIAGKKHRENREWG